MCRHKTKLYTHSLRGNNSIWFCCVIFVGFFSSQNETLETFVTNKFDWIINDVNERPRLLFWMLKHFDAQIGLFRISSTIMVFRGSRASFEVFSLFELISLKWKGFSYLPVLIEMDSVWLTIQMNLDLINGPQMGVWFQKKSSNSDKNFMHRNLNTFFHYSHTSFQWPFILPTFTFDQKSLAPFLCLGKGFSLSVNWIWFCSSFNICRFWYRWLASVSDLSDLYKWYI